MTTEQEAELIARVVMCETLCKRLINENQETRALLNTILDRLFPLTELLGHSSEQFEADCRRSLERALSDDRIRTAPESVPDPATESRRDSGALRIIYDPPPSPQR